MMKAKLERNNHHSLVEQTEWLKSFEQVKGRRLRVLHVGNIANNAYINAKLMRRFGIDADVICNDYYDVMGYPEWEELDLELDWVDRIHPKFTKKMLNGYQRPSWFYQGPLWLLLNYLEGSSRLSFKKYLCKLIIFYPNGYSVFLSIHAILIKGRIKFKPLKKYAFRFAKKIRSFLKKKRRQKNISFLELIYKFFKKIKLDGWAKKTKLLFKIFYTEKKFFVLKSFYKAMKKLILGRPSFEIIELDENLPMEDLMKYCNKKIIIKLKKLFQRYDIIQCYANSGVYPLCAGVKYLSYEHGTIRTIPFEDSVRGRVSNAVYKNAEIVFITNSDCHKIAINNNFGKKRYPLPHAVDTDKLFSTCEKYKKTKNIKFNKLTFIAPARQFKTKRNDLLIMALTFLRDLDFQVIFIEWGANLSENKALIKKLQVEDKIIWKPVMGKKLLWQHYVACAGVIDSFGIPAMGTVAIEALAFSSPLISHLDLPTLKNFFGAVPPMLNCSEPEEIAKSLRYLIENPKKAQEIGIKAQKWIKDYHSSETIISTQLKAYKAYCTAC